MGEHQRMSQKEFTPARSLLPGLLTRLARESGRASHLAPVWADVVGVMAAKHTRPVELVGSVLRVRAQSPRWVEALKGQEQDVLARLAERLGSGVVTALTYEAVEPK